MIVSGVDVDIDNLSKDDITFLQSNGVSDIVQWVKDRTDFEDYIRSKDISLWSEAWDSVRGGDILEDENE